MGSKGSTPQQQAVIRGQQISAGSWMQRLKEGKQQKVQAQQMQQVATKRDLVAVQHELRRDIDKVRTNRTTTGEMVGRGAKMMARGFSDISKSLSTPSAPGHRPKIAQMPEPRKSPMVQGYDLSRLKMPSMRGRDIRGKRVK